MRGGHEYDGLLGPFGMPIHTGLTWVYSKLTCFTVKRASIIVSHLSVIRTLLAEPQD